MFMMSKEQLKERVAELQKEGYTYIARCKDSDWLTCYSVKPKKFMDLEIWGYANPDAPGVKMAYPLQCLFYTEINWSNRSPLLITDFLENY